MAVPQAQAPTVAALIREAGRFALALLGVLGVAGARADEYRVSSYVFGTIAQITVLDADPTRARRAVERVLGEFDRMHRDLHAWKPGELVALNQAIARGELNVRTTSEIAALILQAQGLAAKSGNLFNPAIGRLVGLWSFHRDRPGGPLPDARDIARLVAAHPRMSDITVEGNEITSANPSVQLDFGGYAKGFALDRAMELLREDAVSSALVNVGGNAMALGRRGSRPWRVGLDAPRGAGLLATLELNDGDAVGTSGDYRRYYEIDGKRYSHIIDPRTGYPVAGVESVTVLVPGGEGAGALSDAASKPIFIEGRSGWRQAAAGMGVSRAMLIDSEGIVHVTEELRARLHFGSSVRFAID
jgi:thiamine biosynthesis lipoprotein